MGNLIWINTKALFEPIKQALEQYPNETGGILLGYRDENDSLVITDITLAGPNAKHTENSFVPDYEYDVKRALEIYNESAGIKRYLGDWHSHPSGSTCPSEKDYSTLKKIAASEEAQLSNPIMMIVGLNPFKIDVWKHNKPGSVESMTTKLFSI